MRETFRKASPFGLIEYDGDGIIEGFPAVFGNVDADGDVVLPGSFARTIRERGRKAVLGLDHMHGLGTTLELVEVGRNDLPEAVLAAAPDATGGLYAKGQVMLTPPNIAHLETLRKALDEGVPVGMSFTYAVMSSRKARSRYGRDVNELVELRLDEWGPDLYASPRNAAARLTGAKAALPDTDDDIDAARALAKAIAGSFEAFRDDLAAAVRALPQFAGRDGNAGAYIEATYPDAVVVCQWAADGGNAYWRIPYATLDGAIELGEPVEVDVTTVITPAAKASETEAALLAYVNEASARLAGARAKAGRVLSNVNLDDLDAAIDALRAIRARAVKDAADAAGKGDDEDQRDGAGPASAKATAIAAADDLDLLAIEIGLIQTRAAVAAVA